MSPKARKVHGRNVCDAQGSRVSEKCVKGKEPQQDGETIEGRLKP